MRRVWLVTIAMVLAVVGMRAQADNWFVSEVEAKQYALDHNVRILMVFAGSDWCRPCIQFKKEILEDSTFVSFYKEELAILYLDFPSKKKNQLSNELRIQNERLAEQHNRSGTFPKILLMDANMNTERELKFGGRTVADFIKQF